MKRHKRYIAAPTTTKPARIERDVIDDLMARLYNLNSPIRSLAESVQRLQNMVLVEPKKRA